MKSTINRSLKEEFWQEQMSEAESFKGSLKEFCESRGHSIHVFHYWRKRFARKVVRSSLPTVVSRNRFVEVEVTSQGQSSYRLPEAKWLAEFILHMQGGVK